MQEIKTELMELLQRGDLMRSSLLAGRVRDCRFSDHLHVEAIMELAGRAWHKSAKAKHDSSVKAQKINIVLFDELGLQGKGEKYKQVIDDPNRYYIDKVLEKKVASPLALTIIYAVMAEQLGLDFDIVSLPSYYFLKVSDDAGDFYIDTFDSGKFQNDE